jgi:hypothetical protein
MSVKQLDDLLLEIETNRKANNDPVDPHKSTAIQLVSGYTGFGVHTFLSALKNFPKMYENFIFASAAVVDSGSFKGTEGIKKLEASVEAELKKYVRLARKLGFPADYRLATGTDVMETAVDLCKAIKKEFPRSTVFTGKLVFRKEKLFHKILHNHSAFAIQNKLHWDEITSVILPIRIS